MSELNAPRVRVPRTSGGARPTAATGALRSRLVRSATLVLLAGAAHADANGSPVGAEFQVNTYTTSAQRYAAIARTADGGFVVVWESRGSSGDDGSWDSIQGQRFSADGVPQGGEFQINSYTTSSQLDPSVAMDADGDFVVVWESYGSNGNDSSSWSIQGQRFSAAGVPQGAEFQFNAYTLSSQQNPSIAAAPGGDFVVVWDSRGSNGSDSDNASVQGQRFSAAGVPQGGQFQVNMYTPINQIFPSVAVDTVGNFVVVWQSRGSTGDDSDFYSVQARRYSAEGAAQGPEFQVNSYTTSIQGHAAVAMHADGDFVVAWKSNGSSGSDSSSYSVQIQRYAADGEAQGAELQVNIYTSQAQDLPSVATAADGGFVVVWQSIGSNGGDISFLSVQGQRFSADGAPEGAEFQVNGHTPLDQECPVVAMDAGGDFVVAWQSLSSLGGDNSSYSVQARRFRQVLFADGFESGDFASWSSAAP